MPKLSVCVEMFWGDESVQDRVKLASAAGFKAVEFWGWKGKDLDAIKASAAETGVSVATFCMTPERPLVDPNAGEALAMALDEAAVVAKPLGVDRLILTTGNERKKERFDVTRRTVVRNLKALVPVLERYGLTLVLEPLNPVKDHLGYWLTTIPEAADIVYEVDSPHVRILFDIYHQQITEGNIITTVQEYGPLVGHYHCAGVPGRCELVGGELDYRAVFKAIDASGYDAFVGLEFRPQGDTSVALEQALELAR